MGEFLSKGTKLSVATVPTGSAEPSYKKLYGLFSVPEMEGAPDQIDVTNLEDGSRRSINGLGAASTLDFQFYATEGETDTTEQVRDTWNILRGNIGPTPAQQPVQSQAHVLAHGGPFHRKTENAS